MQGEVIFSVILTAIIVSVAETFVLHRMNSKIEKNVKKSDKKNEDSLLMYERKISALESDIEELNKKISRVETFSSDKSGLDELRNEISEHRKYIKDLSKYLKKEDIINKPDEKFVQYLDSIEKRLSKIEKETPKKGIPDDVDSMFRRIAERIKTESGELSSLKNEVIQLKEIIRKQNEIISRQEESIKQLKNKADEVKKISLKIPEKSEEKPTVKKNAGEYREYRSEPISEVVVPEEQKATASTKTESVIKVNKTYINKILDYSKELKSVIGEKDYTRFTAELNNVIDLDDFSDPEETMTTVHNATEKFIYGSFIKVAPEQIDYLRQFILKCGYKQVEISENASLTNMMRYFKDVFPVKTDMKSKDSVICKVNRESYIITYDNDGDNEELLLKGSCDYYKYEG